MGAFLNPNHGGITMSTYIPSVAETVLCMIGLIVCACLLARLKKPAPPVRDEQLIRHHRSIRERQFGEGGFTRAQVLFCLTGILGAHAILVILYCILYGLFGAAEPKW